jgi:hypothetical protein
MTRKVDWKREVMWRDWSRGNEGSEHREDALEQRISRFPVRSFFCPGSSFINWNPIYEK